MTLAFCLGFRNWHLRHLERCLQSIRAHTNADIAVADLGSDRMILRQLRRICSRSTVGASLIEVTRPEWSRSVALNLAAQCVGTPDYLVFTDADMIFPEQWFKVVSETVTDASTLWLTRSRDLDEETTQISLRINSLFNAHRTSPAQDDWLYTHSTAHGNDLGQGAAMVVPRPWFQTVGGFDEFYQVWGCEDNDLTARATWDGLQVRWLPHAWVAHQWHRRDWPTPDQFDHVRRNREYFSQRLAAQGPVVRNQLLNM